MSLRFEDIDLTPELKRSVAQAGYVTCTPIQEMALPETLQGHDVIGVAKTGTGTVAFLLRYSAPRAGGELQALVICPRASRPSGGGEAEKLGTPLGVRTPSSRGMRLGPRREAPGGGPSRSARRDDCSTIS